MIPHIIRIIMVAMLTAVSTHAPDYYYQTGKTSRYDPGIMEAQAAYHGHNLADYDGGIAVADCGQIGRVWLVRPLGAADWHRMIVLDCAGRDAYDEHGILWMDTAGIIVELDYDTAVRWGAVRGGIDVEVLRPLDG